MRKDLTMHNLYGNHSGVNKHRSAVLAKIVSGSTNYFLLVFPRWIWRFIYVLFLPPIGFLLRKGNGHIIINPSTHIHNRNNTGGLNDHMDKHNTADVPQTFYALAQCRHWARIWSIRIHNPWTEIRLYKDDIKSTFC